MAKDPPRQGDPWRRTLATARAHPLRSAAAVVVLALLVLVLVWDWNWIKVPVETGVSARTGRAFEIAGDLDVDLGRTTVVRADGLRLGNADWSETPEMARAEQLELHVRVFPLLVGRVHLPVLRLTRPDILLETGEDGGNWRFDGMDGDGGDGPRIARLLVAAGRLRVGDAANAPGVARALQRREEEGGTRPLTLRGDGHWRGEAFELTGAVASPL